MEREFLGLGIILVSVASIMAAIALITTGERAWDTAEMPTLHVGDEWVYRVTNGITYTAHYKVIAEEAVDNENFYVIETSYSPSYHGINSGETIWAEKETGDYTKTQTSSNYMGSSYTKTLTFTYQYQEENKWPIEVGKEYSLTRTLTYTISAPYEQTGTENTTHNIKVEKGEDITVPAGTFPCFKIVNYDENGNVVSTWWYSDNAKQYVKITSNETGEILELVSYSIRDGSLAISGVMELEVGDEATFTITSRGLPVENALVEVDGTTENSGSDGAVTFVFDQPGDFAVTATKEGYEETSIPVTVRALPEGAPYYEIVACANQIHDGDTISVGILKLVVELHPEGEVFEGAWERARFGGGVDAPELWDYTPPRSGEPGAVEATELIENLIPFGTKVYLDLNGLSLGGQTGRPYRGEWERLIAVIYVEVEGWWVNVNAELLRWGMEEYPDHDWLKYAPPVYPSEWDPYEWLEEDYPYVRGGFFGLKDVMVLILPEESTGASGENVTFTVFVKNTGWAEDTYKLIASDNAGWNLMLTEDLVEDIAPNDVHTITLIATIPIDAENGATTNITVTATCQDNSEISGSDSCTLRVGPL